jgi:hypothetical protein
MAEDEYLRILRQGVHAVDAEEPEQSTDETVEERQGHGRTAWSTRQSWSSPTLE